VMLAENGAATGSSVTSLMELQSVRAHASQ
jgi:hypothetical protein